LALPGCVCRQWCPGPGGGLTRASEVTLVEQDPSLAKGIQAIVTRLKAEGSVRVERGDALAALRQRQGAALDLVFLDPPFGDGGNEALFRSPCRRRGAPLASTA